MTTAVWSAGLRKLFSDTFIVGDGEEIKVSITLPVGASIPTDTLNIVVVFKDRSVSPANVIWATNDRVVYFTCTGWNKPDGAALATPVEFGSNSDGPLFANLSAHLVGTRNIVHLEILQRSSPTGLMGLVTPT
jgi:hypothetical protein